MNSTVGSAPCHEKIASLEASVREAGRQAARQRGSEAGSEVDEWAYRCSARLGRLLRTTDCLDHGMLPQHLYAAGASTRTLRYNWLAKVAENGGNYSAVAADKQEWLYTQQIGGF